MDGIPISKIKTTDFSEIISFVDQKIILFNATISENLSMWNSSIKFEQLTKAAKIAHSEWIINRPDGYEHKLENGSNVSGGEKARLEIAKHLPRILFVLDEATAFETENGTETNIKHCTGGIIISHRIDLFRFVTNSLSLIKVRLPKKTMLN